MLLRGWRGASGRLAVLCFSAEMPPTAWWRIFSTTSIFWAYRPLPRLRPVQSVHLVRGLEKEDIVIAISFRRGLRMTIEGIQQARKQHAYCIGITDTYISPVARFCDEFFLAPVDTTSFGVSVLGPFVPAQCSVSSAGGSPPRQNVAHHEEGGGRAASRISLFRGIDQNVILPLRTLGWGCNRGDVYVVAHLEFHLFGLGLEAYEN